uniref:Uncharacterized protein n=1 Tax=Magallana gigas TaxID=29159 RepID=A0A8W8MU87_MAGGI
MTRKPMDKLILIFLMIPILVGTLPDNAYRIFSCPVAKNKTAWEEASKRLKCDEDPRKNMLYHCLPSTYLNETIEFCGKLSAVSPGSCPIYNYENGATVATNPACFKINKVARCYYAEPSCPKEEIRFCKSEIDSEECNLALENETAVIDSDDKATDKSKIRQKDTAAGQNVIDKTEGKNSTEESKFDLEKKPIDDGVVEKSIISEKMSLKEEHNHVKNISDGGVVVENTVTVKHEAEKSEKLRNEIQEGTFILPEKRNYKTLLDII